MFPVTDLLLRVQGNRTAIPVLFLSACLVVAAHADAQGTTRAQETVSPCHSASTFRCRLPELLVYAGLSCIFEHPDLLHVLPGVAASAFRLALRQTLATP